MCWLRYSEGCSLRKTSCLDLLDNTDSCAHCFTPVFFNGSLQLEMNFYLRDGSVGWFHFPSNNNILPCLKIRALFSPFLFLLFTFFNCFFPLLQGGKLQKQSLSAQYLLPHPGCFRLRSYFILCLLYSLSQLHPV